MDPRNFENRSTPMLLTDCVMTVAKEIQLQHRAAVVSMAVVDRAMQLLGSALGGQMSGVKDLDMTGGHQVVICSEQQIKVTLCLTCLLPINPLMPTVAIWVYSYNASCARPG